jgi:hypothetical protein
LVTRINAFFGPVLRSNVDLENLQLRIDKIGDRKTQILFMPPQEVLAQIIEGGILGWAKPGKFILIDGYGGITACGVFPEKYGKSVGGHGASSVLRRSNFMRQLAA